MRPEMFQTHNVEVLSDVDTGLVGRPVCHLEVFQPVSPANIGIELGN